MATLKTKKEDISKTLSDIKNRLLQLKEQRDSSAGSSELPDYMKYGASGRGEIKSTATPEEIADYDRNAEAVFKAGVPTSAFGDTNKSGKTNYQNPGGYQEPVLGSGNVNNFIKNKGLAGMVDPKMYIGKTVREAEQLLGQEQAKRMGQVSANTSFAFNPEILKRTQRAIDKFGFALNDVSNDPFEPKEFKDEESNNVIEVTSKELGSLFESPDQLYAAYNTNQQFRDSFDKFVKKGGTLEGVSKNITGPVSPNLLQEAQSQLGGENVQSPDQYLANLRNPQADQEAERIALEEMAPESAIAQQEIMRVAGISKDLQTLYFGDEKTMGVLQMKQAQAQERKKLIEEQERDAKRTVRERAELTLEKNKADVEETKAKIEENRLTAKNYMTNQLAKLGALNTSGAAPQALQTLETKYQGQVTQIESAYKFAEREIEIGLTEDIDEIENQADEMILGIEEDITLDREASIKEILKARQASDKEIYRITEQYARRLRDRTSKYTTDLKKEAEKYAKEFAKSASNGLDGGPLGLNNYNEGDFVSGKGVLLPDGSFAKLKLTPTLEREVESANLSGESTIRYFVSLAPKYRQALVQEAQGTGMNFSTLGKLQSKVEEIKAQEKAEKGGTDAVSQLESKLGL